MRILPRREKWGFNLLEVTIAAFIFSTVSISFIGVWGQQVRALEKSRHLLVATLLAEEYISDSMAKGYEQSKADEGPEEIPLSDLNIFHEIRDPQGNWTEAKVNYYITREVFTYVDPDTTNPDDDKLKQVVVRVKWEDTTKSGEVVLETFLAGAQ
jgi:Tfp pilus assembly protein PilV